MLIEFTLRRSTIESLLRKAGPVRIQIGTRLRWVELGPPEHVELVPHRGLRIVTTGHVRCAVDGLESSVETRRLQLMVEPRLVHGPDVMRLVVGLEIDELDLPRISAFWDASVSDFIDAALQPTRERMLWNLGAGFTRSVDLPPQVRTIDSVGLEPIAAELTISEQSVTLRVALDPSVVRADLAFSGDVESVRLS